MQTPPKPGIHDFPTAEGIGIFVGIAAWDLLADGQLELLKALVIATPCALAWYGVRCWRRKRPPDCH